MPYISQLYHDSDNKDKKKDDEVIRSCIQEMNAGHIPVYLRKGRLLVEFYASRDVSIHYILTSLNDIRFNNNTIRGIFYTTYNEKTEQYQDAVSIHDRTSPLVDIVANKNVKVFIDFKDMYQDSNHHLHSQ